LLFFTGRYEVYRYFWFAYENLEGTATLELEPDQHNSLDRLQRWSKYQTPYCLWQWLHWNWSEWCVVSQQLPTLWPNKIGVFRADNLVRHLLQLAHDSQVLVQWTKLIC